MLFIGGNNHWPEGLIRPNVPISGTASFPFFCKALPLWFLLMPYRRRGFGFVRIESTPAQSIKANESTGTIHVGCK